MWFQSFLIMFVRIIALCKQELYVDGFAMWQTQTQQCGSIAMLNAELSF